MEEKEVDETDNTHLSLVLIKIRKGIGIKHKYCFGCKQLTSVNHKHFTTKMLKIQQETQGRGRIGKLRPKTYNWTRNLGWKLRISTSTSHSTCKLETNLAPGCNYEIIIDRNSCNGHQLTVIYLDIKTTQLNMETQSCKKYNKIRNQLLMDNTILGSSMGQLYISKCGLENSGATH